MTNVAGCLQLRGEITYLHRYNIPLTNKIKQSNSVNTLVLHPTALTFYKVNEF